MIPQHDKPTQTTLQPPLPPAGRTVLVVTDFDRTFTRPDLALDGDALDRARDLRAAGIVMVLATGRRAADLPLEALGQGFDGYVLEGGSVWGWPGQWHVHAVPPGFWNLADEVTARGHVVQRGLASFSVARDAEPLRRSALGAVHHNQDRIDVTPAGCDKGTGLRQILENWTHQGLWLLAVGDGDNDIPLFKVCDDAVAVANASTAAKQGARLVAPYAAQQGFLWAVSGLGHARQEVA